MTKKIQLANPKYLYCIGRLMNDVLFILSQDCHSFENVDYYETVQHHFWVCHLPSVFKQVSGYQNSQPHFCLETCHFHMFTPVCSSVCLPVSLCLSADPLFTSTGNNHNRKCPTSPILAMTTSLLPPSHSLKHTHMHTQSHISTMSSLHLGSHPPPPSLSLCIIPILQAEKICFFQFMYSRAC